MIISEGKYKLTTLLASGILFVSFIVMSTIGWGQKLVYSVPDRNETRQTNFEIIGQYGDKYLVYKSQKNNNYISVYNTNMELVKNEALKLMPDRVIDANFVAYPDFSYLFYQYYQKGIVYCMAVKISSEGKALTQPIELDTTATGSNNSAKVYQVLASENKEKIVVLKINNKNEQRLMFKTKLFDKELSLKHTSSNIELEMNDRYDFLTDFSLDNDGDLVFGRGLRRGTQDNITQFFLLVKPAAENGFIVKEIKFDKNYTLDEVKLKLDNYNRRYLFTGFFYTSRKTSIEGIANAIFDKKANEWVVRNTIPLGDDMREDARGSNNSKNAFQDYFIKDITIRSDGAFLVNAEAIYQTNRGYNNSNRWNMMNPYMSPLDYRSFGTGGFGNSMFGNTNTTRYNADNIMALAFDNQGKMILSNFIFKTQFDDNNENMVSYQMINTGNGLQYLYNDYDRREIMLTFQTLTPQGQVVRNPYIKNAQRDYNFIPRYAKQVDLEVVIIPCLFRNTLCFARLEFSQQ